MPQENVMHARNTLQALLMPKGSHRGDLRKPAHVPNLVASVLKDKVHDERENLQLSGTPPRPSRSREQGEVHLGHLHVVETEQVTRAGLH